MNSFTLNAPFRCLERLDLSGNDLTSFSLHNLPALSELILDNNAVPNIERIQYSASLRTVSWRNQRCSEPLHYDACDEVHHLYLSGNTISSFTPQTPFLNLQILELASTGLQTLSEDFGLKCPNLRTINLNYNALRDLRPLLNITRLQRLYLAGNRISRLRRTVAVLERLAPALLELDLRNNPLTVGFYTPPDPQNNTEEKRMVLQGRRRDETTGETSVKDMKYLLPPLDGGADASSRDRLDEDTKLRRRVYEMLTVHACKKLQRLDGLGVERSAVGRKDGVCERLIELGVLRSKG